MANLPDPYALSFLGRRVERLIFGGILLVVLCAVESYLATANKQLAEDRSLSTISNLLNRLEIDETRLTTLFEVKPEAISNNRSLNDISDRQKSIAHTRKMLGLPPPLADDPSEQSNEPRTYREAINKIIGDLGNDPFAQKDMIVKYADPTKPPKDLIKALRQQITERENAPTTVWGIQTPHLLQLQYAGLDYKFPFGFVSGVLEIMLAPLIIGWFGAFYATRQRELIMIAAIDDYKLAFPYILNFLPVNFEIFEIKSRSNQTRNTQRINRKIMSFHRIVLSSFRSFVILVVALPMLLGYIYSLTQLWPVTANEVTYLFYAGVIMAAVMFIQVMNLILQEWVILKGKYFYE